MGSKEKIVALCAAACLLVFSVPAVCQRTTATLYGTVKDASGAVIPGATVELLNEETGARFSGITNEVGELALTFLPVGRYTVKAESAGFKSRVDKGIVLTASQEVRYALILDIGQISETTTVTAETPLLQNATSNSNYSVNKTQLQDLPIARRDFSQLLELNSGVRYDHQGMFQINGLAPGGVSVTVDGVDGSQNTDAASVAMFQGFNQINVMSLEAIEEVVVSKGVIPAEVGNTFSGNINLISKGGTNEYHGSLFENLQNEVLNARLPLKDCSNPSVRCKDPVRFNQFGGSAGGPIKKNKLFFFFTYEGYRQSNSQVRYFLTPTPEFRAKAIAKNAAFTKGFSYFPDPLPGYNPTAVSANAVAVVSNAANDNHFVARVDYRLNDNNSISARITHGRPDSVTPRDPPSVNRYFKGATDVANLTYTRSASTWTSETRFGINFNDATRIQNTFVDKIVAFEIQSNFALEGEEYNTGGHSYSIEEVYAKNKGKHMLKTGFSYTGRAPSRYDEEVPIFRYGSGDDMLNAAPNRVQFTFGSPRYFARVWEMGLFFQDDFRIRPNLTLNLGVRYEYFSVFKDNKNQLRNPGNLASALALPPVFRPPDSIYNSDKNNIVPRVGFAWGLGSNQKTIVRGGFGISVAPPNLQNFGDLAIISPLIPFRFRFSKSDAQTLKLVFPMTNTDMLDVMAKQNVPRSYATVDENSPNPYAMQWTLDLQREIMPNMVISLGYSGNKANKITMPLQWNTADRITGNRPAPNVLEFYYNGYGDFSYYHGFTASLRKRMSGSLQYNISYTWSRTFAIGQGDFWPGNNTRVQNPFNPRADLGPTDMDIPHNFVGDAVYILPLDTWLNARGSLGQFLHGWEFSGILKARSGKPISVVQKSNLDSSRPDALVGDPYTGEIRKYLDATKFALVPVIKASGLPARPGNAGKNSLRGLGYYRIDFALAKNFKIGERIRLRFRADMFNMDNHIIWGNPNNDLTASNFGQINGTDSPRTIQVGLRLTF